MQAGYQEQIYFKNKFIQKLNILKHKKISITYFLTLISLFIAMTVSFVIVFSNYKQTHPYSSLEVSELTSIVYVIPYLDESSEISYYIQTDSITETSNENNSNDEITQVENITTNETYAQEVTDITVTEYIDSTQEQVTTTATTTSDQTTQTTTTTTTQTTTTQTTTTQSTTTTTQASSTVVSSSLDINTLIYVTASGSKFHFSTCSYLSDSNIELTYGEALELGYSPCSRCFPNG